MPIPTPLLIVTPHYKNAKRLAKQLGLPEHSTKWYWINSTTMLNGLRGCDYISFAPDIGSFSNIAWADLKWRLQTQFNELTWDEAQLRYGEQDGRPLRFVPRAQRR